MAGTEGQSVDAGEGADSGTATLDEGSTGSIGLETTESVAETGEDESAPPEDEGDTETIDTDDEDGEAAPETDAAEATASDEQEYRPYSVVVGRDQVPVQGVFQAPDGSLYVHPDAVESFQRVVQDAHLRNSQDKKELTTLRRQLHEAKVKFDADGVTNKATAAWWQKQFQAWKENPEAMFQFAAEFNAKLPELAAAQKETRAQALYDAAQKIQMGDPDQARQREEMDAEATVKSVVQTLMSNAAYKEQLDSEQWEAFGDLLWQNRGQMFTRADRDYPEHGVRKGQLVYQTPYVNSQLQWYLGALAARKAGKENVEKARAFNQQRGITSKTGRKLPPAVGTRTQGSTSGGRSPKKFSSWREWQDSYLANDHGPSIEVATP